MKDYYTTSSHYITYTFIFKRLGECPFELEYDGVNHLGR